MEKWKTIAFESEYEVSSFGSVRNKKTLRIKSTRLDKYGYSRVTLYPSGKTYTIHRLVALTHLPNVNQESQVNHIDGNKLNNATSNLEWCSAKENVEHSIKTGLRPFIDISGCNNPMASFTEENVEEIRRLYSEGKTIRQIAAIYGEDKGKRVYEKIRRLVRGQQYANKTR